MENILNFNDPNLQNNISTLGNISLGNSQQNLMSQWNQGFNTDVGFQALPVASDGFQNRLPGMNLGDQGTPPTFWQRMFGKFDEQTGRHQGGMFTPITQGISAVGNIGVGFKQIQNAERALDMQEDQFNRNFDLQAEMINRKLQAREYTRARMAGASEEDARKAGSQYVTESGVGKF